MTPKKDVSEILRSSSEAFAAVRGQARGRRVLVFGTGPSARNVDLSLAKGDLSITVNNFGFHDQVDDLSPNYHILADPGYWDGTMTEEVEVYLRSLEFVNRTGTRILMPSWGLEAQGGTIYSSWDPLYFRYGARATGFDFSQEIPQFGQNVLNVALMFCLHLQAQDVVLVGFDNGGFITDYRQQAHFYPEAGGAEFSGDMSLDLEACLYNHLREQSTLYREARRVGMSISTASPSGPFRRYPHVPYASLFEGTSMQGRPAAAQGARPC